MKTQEKAPRQRLNGQGQGDKDRLAASLDYEVNLKVELEVLRLHEKLDFAVNERLDQLLRQQAAIVALLSGSEKSGQAT